MPRPPRVDIGGMIYHCLNRANAGMQIFDSTDDYQLFERTLEEAIGKTGMRVYVYCVMPNHFHLVLSPQHDGDLARFMNRLTMTHTQRWHARMQTTGSGHLYQGRYKSFLVNNDTYFLELVRYVEQNPLKAGLVRKAEEWQWSSLWQRQANTEAGKSLLSPWPTDTPPDYLQRVNDLVEEKAAAKIQASILRGMPLGEEHWTSQAIERYGLQSALRSKGRPKKGS